MEKFDFDLKELVFPNPKKDASKDVEKQFEKFLQILNGDKGFVSEIEEIDNNGNYCVEVKSYYRQHKDRNHLKIGVLILLFSFVVLLGMFWNEISKLDVNGTSLFFAIYSLITSTLLVYISFRFQYSRYEEIIYDLYFQLYKEVYLKYLNETEVQKKIKNEKIV